MLFKVCRVRLPSNSRTPGAGTFKKINVGRLVIVGNTAKDLGLKLSKKITMLSLVKKVEFCILHSVYEGVTFIPTYFELTLPSGSCCCVGLGEESRWSLLHLIFQILLAKLFVCVQEITLKLYFQQF